MRKQFVKTIENIFANDKDFVLLLCDIGVYGFRNSFKKFPDKIYNIGIMEQSTVGLSAGISLCGLNPTIHTIAPFLIERAYEQIKVDLCYNNLMANLVSVGGSFDYSGLGCTHHCPNDVNLINNLPNTNVFLPGDEDEFNFLFNKYYKSGKVNYFRLSEYSNQYLNTKKLSNSHILKEGNELAILVVGNLLENVLRASSDLDVTILYTNTIKPFDITILEKFKNQKLLIFEPYTPGAIINNILNSGYKIQKGINNYGIPIKFIDKYGSYSDLISHVGLNEQSIRHKIIENIND